MLRDSLGRVEQSLVGELLSYDQSVMLLEVPWVFQQTTTGPRNLNQRLRLTPGDVAMIEQRRVDRLRTGVALGAAGLGGVLLIREMLGGRAGGQGAENPDPGGQPQAARLLQFPLWVFSF